ncbi:hypothetical protein C8J57DRAFT_1727237 [Mycena rebaudengoi]|nr:hypothetical protein C8J57DRAFT_1727237 [Mycena rebaudengoi]
MHSYPLLLTAQWSRPSKQKWRAPRMARRYDSSPRRSPSLEDAVLAKRYTAQDEFRLFLCELATSPFLEQNSSNYDADVDCAEAGKRWASSLPLPPPSSAAPFESGLGPSAPAHRLDAGVALKNKELCGCMMPANSRRMRTRQAVALHHISLREQTLVPSV